MMRKSLMLGLAVLLVLGLSGAGHATSISFLFGGLGAGTNINNGNAFNIGLANGGATEVFVNNTGQTIKDFHFSWTNNENNVVGEDDFVAGGAAQKAFGSFTAAANMLDFFNMPGGAGIANGAKFSISLTGFANNANANVSANATFAGGKGKNSTTAPFGQIPEPASFWLLGAAVVGLLAARRRTKDARPAIS